MSQRVRQKNGFIATVSDRVAAIMIQEPGCALVRTRPDLRDGGQRLDSSTPAAKKETAE